MGKNERAKIVMTDDEIARIHRTQPHRHLRDGVRTGAPHLVAMWYAVLDGEMWFETKAKSQKAVNLRRNPTVTVMVEDGLTYDTLRGVSIEGRGEIVDDPDVLLRVGISVWERYTGPYTDEMRPFVDQMMNNRIAVRVVPKPDPQLGSPQTRHGADAGGRQHRAVPGLRRTWQHQNDPASWIRPLLPVDLPVRHPSAGLDLPPHRREGRRQVAHRRRIP